MAASRRRARWLHVWMPLCRERSIRHRGRNRLHRQATQRQHVRTLWKRRHGGRPSPVLLVILYPEQGQTKAAVCGPVGEDPPVLAQLEPGQAERIADAALAEPDKHAAIRFLHSVLPEAETELPGVRNVGCSPTTSFGPGSRREQTGFQLVSRRSPSFPPWPRELIRALGYTVEQHTTTTSLLKAGGRSASSRSSSKRRKRLRSESAVRRVEPSVTSAGCGRHGGPALCDRDARQPDPHLRGRQ